MSEISDQTTEFRPSFTPDTDGGTHETLDRQKELAELDQFIYERAREALEDCEFEATPEVSEALTGYYTDHYHLAAAIRAYLEGDYNNPIFDRLLEQHGYEVWEKEMSNIPAIAETNRGDIIISSAPNVKVLAARLAKFVRETPHSSEEPSDKLSRTRRNGLLVCGKAVVELFSECSVGITTVGDSEIALTAEIADQIKAELPDDNRIIANGDFIRRRIESSLKTFWADTRYAGQLEFHGTINLGSINQSGLMPRSEQLRQSGKVGTFNLLTSDGLSMPSDALHFSEFYALGEYSGREHGGTLAIPLIKIIREAPYARDARYGVIRLKEGRQSDERIPTPTLTTPTASVGAGSADVRGAGGLDRVFFASADEESERSPTNYSVSMLDKSNKPATYIVDRGYQFHSPERETHGMGYGHGFPERLVIEAPEQTDVASRQEARIASARDAIVRLQEEYFKAYNRFGVIIPLRRGVFAQQFENMPPTEGAGRAPATKYNRLTPERKTA